MKYTNRRNYRDKMEIEEETIIKKTVKKKREKSVIKNLINKLFKKN